MLTTMLPWKTPEGTLRIAVLYIGTVRSPTGLASSPGRSSMWRGMRPASASSCSHEKEHPRRKPTVSAFHAMEQSEGSSASWPSRQMRYRETSERMSEPGATFRGHGSPGSVAARIGHARGFRRANTKKSNAWALGRATRLHWVNPGAKPDVCPRCCFERMAARADTAAARSTSELRGWKFDGNPV